MTNTGESRLEEPGKNLQSNPEDVSLLKDGNSSLPTDLDAANCQSLDTIMCEQPEPNSEEQQKLTGKVEIDNVATNKTKQPNNEGQHKLIGKGDTEDVAANKTNAANLTEGDRCSEKHEKSNGPVIEISVDCNMPDKITGHVEASREIEKAAIGLPNQSHEDDLTRDSEVISKPKNSELTKEKSCSDKPSASSKEPKGDKPNRGAAEGGDDPKKRPRDQAGKNTSDASNSTYKKVPPLV